MALNSNASHIILKFSYLSYIVLSPLVVYSVTPADNPEHLAVLAASVVTSYVHWRRSFLEPSVWPVDCGILLIISGPIKSCNHSRVGNPVCRVHSVSYASHFIHKLLNGERGRRAREEF